MKIDKKDLGFLEILSSVADPTTVISGRVYLRKEANRAYIKFEKITSNNRNYYSYTLPVDNSEQEAFELNFPTGAFAALVKKSPGTFIELSAKGIKMSNGAEYSFDIQPGSLPDFSVEIPNAETVVLDEIDKLVKAKTLSGTDALDYVSAFTKDGSKYSFVASDSLLYSIIKSETSQLVDGFSLPNNLLGLFLRHGVTNITMEVSPDRKQLTTVLNGVSMFISTDCKLPNLLLDEWSSVYTNPASITVEKEELIEVLDRMNLVTNTNPGNRVKFSVEGDTLVIRNDDSNVSSESVRIFDTKGDVTNVHFFVSSVFAHRILKNLDGVKAVLSVNNPTDMLALGITDESEVDWYYHNVYENSDSGDLL